MTEICDRSSWIIVQDLAKEKKRLIAVTVNGIDCSGGGGGGASDRHFTLLPSSIDYTLDS